jgi:hypothetical protein
MDFVEAYHQLPVVTRTYVTLCVLTTAACSLEVRLIQLYLEKFKYFGQSSASTVAHTIFFTSIVNAVDHSFQYLFQLPHDYSRKRAMADRHQLLLLWQPR